jgi:hypothetical protein
MMRRYLLILGGCLALTTESAAQFAVHDPAVTARNSAAAAVKELMLSTEREQHAQLRRMAQRLSRFTNLGKYAASDPPRWLTHRRDVVVAREYLDALMHGDLSGAAYLAVSHPVSEIGTSLDRLNDAARRAILTRVATVEGTDASVMRATHDMGQLRFTGRNREHSAIDVLERDVVNGSNEQSTTAVLDKVSGALLLGARQRQARMQLLAGVVEQLLIDTKRARDADAAAMNMQLVTWRDGRAANKAFVTGTGEALQTWRQP